MKRALGAALAAVLATAGFLVGLSSSAAQTAPGALAPDATPVIMVHGYSGASCPGGNVLHDIWGGLYVTLADAGWTGALLPVSFYQCDTNGVDITGYGPTPPAGATTAITSGYPRAGYTDSTGLQQIAHDLAWFVYDTYSSAGTPVDLVGGSMGGLIVRYALYRVAQQDPDFPPYLYAYHVVTASTPHDGYGTLASNVSFCGGTVQCEQMATDSTFIADLKANALDPQGWGGSAWSLLGSSAGCDFIPASSSLAMPYAEQIDYTSPCYSHTGYVTDYATTLDATTVVSTPGTAAQTITNAPHGLQLLRQVLSRAEVLTPPTSTPTPTSSTPTPTPTPPTPTSSSPTPTPDSTAPTVSVSAPAAPFQASTALRFSYQAADAGSGVLGYEARYRVAPWNSGFGSYRYPAAWQQTTAASLTLSGSTGREYCFSVRATDRVGNVSAWTPDRCTSVALDDRSLSAATSGWSRLTTSGYYFHTQTRTSLRGAELRLRGAHLDRLALVVAECRTCGKLAIYLDNTLWRTVNTYASSTHYRVIVVEPRFSLRIATVTLKNADGKVTVIDGMAITRT